MKQKRRQRRRWSDLLALLVISSRAHGFVSSDPTMTRRSLKNSRLRQHPFRASGTPPTSRLFVTARSASFDTARQVEQEIVRLGRTGKTDEALALFLSADGHRSIRLLNGAIDACARARPTQIDRAFQLFEESNLEPNVFTFGALMNACNRDRDAERALSLLEAMKTKYGVKPNAVVYSSAISACARSQPPRKDAALQLLRQAVEEDRIPMNVVGFNAAISACAQAGDWENAISLVNRMVEAAKMGKESEYLVPAPDLVTYGTVLAACEKGEQWELVLKYAQSAIDTQMKLDGIALTSCLHACQQLGLATEAMNYLSKMKSAQPTTPQTAKLQRSGAKQPLHGPDAVAYRLAISACARGGAWREGIRLLEEYSASTGQPADVIAYTAAITGCEYAGQWKEAFLLLDKMRKAGVQPNEVTMAAIIGACAVAVGQDSGNDMVVRTNTKSRPTPVPQTKALQLLEILSKHPTLPKPNIQIYNAAIRVCAEAGDLPKAFELLAEVESKGIERTEVTYGSLVTACERVGDVESLSKAFQKLRDDEIEPNEIIYGAAISCCRKAKQSERALLLLRKMMKEGLSPNVATLNTVLVAQAEGRNRADSERAIIVYKLMKSKFVDAHGRPNRQTYNILVNYFASMLQPLTAEEFLKAMQEDGFKPDVHLFTATVAAYERTGQPLKALRLMESMQEDGYDFYSVKVLNSAFSKAVKLVNKVGRTMSSEGDESKQESSLQLMQREQGDDELMV